MTASGGRPPPNHPLKCTWGGGIPPGGHSTFAPPHRTTMPPLRDASPTPTTRTPPRRTAPPPTPAFPPQAPPVGPRPAAPQRKARQITGGGPPPPPPPLPGVPRAAATRGGYLTLHLDRTAFLLSRRRGEVEPAAAPAAKTIVEHTAINP